MSSSSNRVLLLALAFWPLCALSQQDYVGVWTARHPGGGTVTLTLQAQGEDEVVGKLEGAGASFDVEAEVRADGIVGMVTGAEAMVYLSGRLSGNGTLLVMLIEPGPGGQPNPQSARQIRFSR